MQDFIIGGLVSAAIFFGMSQIMAAQQAAGIQQHCLSEGGTWSAANGGQCSNIPSGNYQAPTLATASNALPDIARFIGIPIAILMTRSVAGGVGAAAGSAVPFLIGISAIH